MTVKKFEMWVEDATAPLNRFEGSIEHPLQPERASTFGEAATWCKARLAKVLDASLCRAVIHDRDAGPGLNCRWMILPNGEARPTLKRSLDGKENIEVQQPFNRIETA